MLAEKSDINTAAVTTLAVPSHAALIAPKGCSIGQHDRHVYFNPAGTEDSKLDGLKSICLQHIEGSSINKSRTPACPHIFCLCSCLRLVKQI